MAVCTGSLTFTPNAEGRRGAENHISLAPSAPPLSALSLTFFSHTQSNCARVIRSARDRR